MIYFLKKLEEKVLSLKTKCVLRNAEIDNIRMIIKILEYHFILLEKRINQLELDESFAGKHENWKNLKS